MAIQLDFYQTLTIVFVIIGGLFTIGKLILLAILNRFNEIEVKNESEDIALINKTDRLNNELMTLKAELPLLYQRREDAIRNQSTIEAKIDGLVNLLAEAHIIDRRKRAREQLDE